jgi:GDPmannose 4,6-dehydratase
MSPKALILGVTGQDGAYLAEFLLCKGYEVHGTSRDHVASSFENLQKLGVGERVIAHSLTLDSLDEIKGLFKSIKPDEIYNLAGQSSVGLSFERPLETFESIAGVTVKILEALRIDQSPARFFAAGSGEMFGETPTPATEAALVDPRSPYGVAKAAAFHAVKSYREAYGLFAATGILFNHESPLRPERFVTQKIVRTAVRIAQGTGETLHLGKIQLNRDWGWASDYGEAMWRILQQQKPDDYVIATGESHSIEDFVKATFTQLGLNWKNYVKSDPSLFRPTDIDHSCGNPAKARKNLGWEAKHRFKEIIALLVDAELKRQENN